MMIFIYNTKSILFGFLTNCSGIVVATIYALKAVALIKLIRKITLNEETFYVQDQDTLIEQSPTRNCILEQLGLLALLATPLSG